MRFHNITNCDMLNGEGVRVVLWVSHCEHKCKGCHNPQTWSSEGGIPFDRKAELELFNYLEDESVQGVTFSGGDPLSCLNRDDITLLAKKVKNIYPDKDIWLYTGYTLEELEGLEILDYIDVLVDGKYEESLSVPSPKWCGSSNQRVIDMNKTREKGYIVIFE